MAGIGTADVAEDQGTNAFAGRPDPERHIKAIAESLEGGFAEASIDQIGADQAGFFELPSREVLPKLKG